MGIFLNKEEKLRNDYARIQGKSYSNNTPKISPTGPAKFIIGFFGSWLGIFILIKIITMVIRALSTY